MNALALAVAGVGLVAAALGWPAARLTGGSRVWAAVLAVPAAGIACSLAVSASILTSTPMWPWLVLAGAGGWVVLARFGRACDGSRGGLTAPGAALAVAAVVAVAPLLLVDVPPVESDARSAWWFHAELFRHGGAVARQGMAEPAFRFSRPAYPPLVPATIATVWHLGGDLDREIALRVGQVVVAAGVALTAFTVVATLRLGRRGALMMAATVAALCWGMNAEVGLSGFADLTWPLFLVPAAVLLLCAPPHRRTIAVGALLVAATALTKSEAQPMALLLVVLAAIRAGRAWRRVVPVAVAAVAAIAAWTAVTLATHAPTEERGDWTRVMDLLRPGTEPHERLVDVLASIGHQSGWLVLAGGVAVLAVVGVARLAGLPLRQPGALALLALAAGYVAFLAVSLAVSEEDLEGYYVTGTYRYVIVVRLLVLVDVVLVWVAALRALGVVAARRPDEPEEPGDDAEAPAALAVP